jgi:hypothetical protein
VLLFWIKIKNQVDDNDDADIVEGGVKKEPLLFWLLHFLYSKTTDCFGVTSKYYYYYYLFYLCCVVVCDESVVGKNRGKNKRANSATNKKQHQKKKRSIVFVRFYL